MLNPHEKVSKMAKEKLIYGHSDGDGDGAVHDGLNFLDLPPELQLMILHEVYADLPKDRHGRQKMTSGGWKPPPILQVCRNLRDLGLSDFSKKPLSLKIKNYDAKHHLARERWLAMLGDELDNATVDCELHISPPTDKELAARNLMAWVKYWYENRRGGLMLKEDRDEGFEDWADTGLIEDKIFNSKSQIHRVAKVFAAAYKLSSAGVAWDVAEAALKYSIPLLLAS